MLARAHTWDKHAEAARGGSSSGGHLFRKQKQKKQTNKKEQRKEKKGRKKEKEEGKGGRRGGEKATLADGKKERSVVDDAGFSFSVDAVLGKKSTSCLVGDDSRLPAVLRRDAEATIRS
jgi:hypothetical protein